MNIKKVIQILLAATLFFTAIPVYANPQETSKTATLNNARISFDGGEPVTVQAYNIDGYNYVRARDITNGIDIKVEAIDWGM